MPSPSKIALFSGLALTAGLFYGGAWFASTLPVANAADGEADAAPEMPKLAPIPDMLKSEASESGPPKWTSTRAPAPEPAGNAKAPEVMRAKPLTVTISGVKDRGGQVLILVFNEKSAYETYDFTRAAGYAEVEAVAGSVSHQFSSLLDGPNAVAVIHDENGNEDLDMSGAYPLEGYGVSGAKNAYDEPKFRDAAIAGDEIVVSLHYLQ